MSAWTRIAHTELTGSQADVLLNNIPNTYTDLLLVCSTRQSYGTEAYFGILLNESNSNTNTRVLYGSGSSTASVNYTGAAANLITFSTGSGATASTFGSTMFYIPNYTSSVAKSVSMDGVSENNGGVAYQIIGAGLWNNTAVIDRIKVVSLDTNANLGGTFSQYSSFTLYGITKGSSGGVSVS